MQGRSDIYPERDDAAFRFMIGLLAALLGAVICALLALVYIPVRLVSS